MFLVPILGITLGFDAINSEQNNGTLGRLLSQPIYRDVVFNGKFLAGTVTIGIMLSTITLLISGLGLMIIGVPPSSEEAFRVFLFLVLGTLYGAFWLGLAMLFSVFLRRVATSALASIAIWVFFIFFMTMITGFIANTIAPVDAASSQQEIMRNLGVQVSAMRASPIGLFQEATTVLLVPGSRTMSEYLQLQTASGALWMPGALPLGQTILIIWPHIVTLIATTAVLFVISYAKFMREEIRST
jgi:ABC-2 type transport system permease protein